MEVLNKLFIRLQAARKANLEHINLHRNVFLRLSLFALCVQQHVLWTLYFEGPSNTDHKKEEVLLFKVNTLIYLNQSCEVC